MASFGTDLMLPHKKMLLKGISDFNKALLLVYVTKNSILNRVLSDGCCEAQYQGAVRQTYIKAFLISVSDNRHIAFPAEYNENQQVSFI